MLPVASTSSRILFDVPCCVCGDNSSGKHYGIHACDGCAGFFKRSVRRGRRYQCKSRLTGSCVVDKAHRNQCRACRYLKCLNSGMKRAAVQNERGPRTSTLRKQMEVFLKDPALQTPEVPLPTSNSYNMAMPPHHYLSPQSLAYFANFYPHSNLFLAPPPPPPSPPPRPPTPVLPSVFFPNSPGVVCESAARLLMMNVEWARSLQGFQILPMHDRLMLLDESWRDLFIIGSAQYLYPVNFNALYEANPHIDMANVRVYQEAIDELMKIHPDPEEYMCFRAVALFRSAISDRTGYEYETFQDHEAVLALYTQARTLLNQHSAQASPMDLTKARRLLRLFPLMNLVRGTTIVDLFFRLTIGPIPLEVVIRDMYRGRPAVEHLHQPY